MANERAYYPYFDWLRGILASVVMLSHEGVIPGHNTGNFAVQVFFALSGWLIGGILLHTDVKDLGRFYFNRAIRIWVPYYIALALLVAAAFLHDEITSKWTEMVAYKLTFVYNLFGPSQLECFAKQMPLQGTGNHFWSVNAEEQFYLLVPIPLILCSRKFGQSVLTWAFIAVLAWYSQTYASIVFGVFAAVAVHKFGPIHENQIVRSAVALILLLSVGGMLAGYDYGLLAPLASLAIVMSLAVKGSKSFVGSVVGGMSYPLYLNHWIGAFVSNEVIQRIDVLPVYSKHLISVSFSFAMATAMYWMIDRKLALIRGSLFTPQRGLFVAILAYAMIVVGLLIHFLIYPNAYPHDVPGLN